MSNNEDIPKLALAAFPILSDAVFIRQLASLVPLVPDTTFDIFTVNHHNLLALVTTDYSDPKNQSLELKNISGQYGFEFVNLLKPGSKNHKTIEILEHDNMTEDFQVYEPYKNYRCYYYLANIKAKPE